MDELKRCSVCGSTCFADMDVCYGCLHRFSNGEGLLHADSLDDYFGPCFEPDQPDMMRALGTGDSPGMVGDVPGMPGVVDSSLAQNETHPCQEEPRSECVELEIKIRLPGYLLDSLEAKVV